MIGKRVLDIVVATVGLFILLIPSAIIAAVVRVTLGSPVLFRQTRPGLQEKPFELLKFRTMRAGSGPDAERLTPFGRFLRSTSLDEVPRAVERAQG